ncbi:dTDP-glucose 4,6-dehydratase [Streptomyces sp. NPDC000345]|uniref:dTDP-glucose 4,6-dehydratase n=1 Tax=Streptomyces sp. NPDC000345 TaxID=3364537 RepID=UPI00368FF839
MRIFVTGGAGFIGSHFVRTLLADGYPGLENSRVCVLDSLTYAGNPANLPPDAERLAFVRGDITDPDLLHHLLPGHDAIVHFAAESHVDRSVRPRGGSAFVRTNVLGTQTLLEAALHTGIGTFLHVSTDEVYGSIDEGSWTEEHLLEPNSPYAASKASGDLLARAYHRTHGLDVRITRCANNYGPHQHVEKLIPHFVTRLLRGLDVPLYGDGGNIREWLHVDDHCRALAAVLTRGAPGRIYNIGGGTELTNRELTGMLLELCGADAGRVRHVEDRKGHDRRYATDDTRIRTELGYAPRWSFPEGLARTVAWYRDHPQWWKPLVAS